MDIFAGIKGLLTGKRSINKISLDELRKERVRLDQIEERIGTDIEKLEDRKSELFAKGKDETNRRKQMAAARKIKELDAGIKGKDRQLAMISKQIRVLSGLATIKENQSMLNSMGVSGILSRMDIGSLQKYVERATVEGKFEMERFGEILKAMEEPEGLEIAPDEDADTLEIMKAMQDAKQEEETDPEAAKRGMQKVDDILHKPRDEEGDELMEEM